MVRYRRNFVPGGTYFFTVTLADRTASLLTERIDALGAAFRQCRTPHPFETIAIVVLPEHLHCIWTLPDGDAEYAIRWSLIKRAFTRRQYHQGPTPAGRKRAVWQLRYWEHTIREETDLQQHIDYVHHNPVKHGYVSRPADWSHSSFHRFVRNQWLPGDWASTTDQASSDFGE
jgi:putative transposase